MVLLQPTRATTLAIGAWIWALVMRGGRCYRLYQLAEPGLRFASFAPSRLRWLRQQFQTELLRCFLKVSMLYMNFVIAEKLNLP